MPHSTRSSTTATPCSASQPGIGVRRPVASTIRRRRGDEAVVDADAACVWRPRRWARRAGPRPGGRRASGSRGVARPPAAAPTRTWCGGPPMATRSSSPGCRTPAGTVAGRVAGQRQLAAPGLAQVVEHVGRLGREERPAPGEERVRVAGLGGGPPRACGAPVRRAGRPPPRSCTRPRRRGRPRARGRRPPVRASARAVMSPATLPPTTTTSASSPASRSIARRRGRRPSHRLPRAEAVGVGAAVAQVAHAGPVRRPARRRRRRGRRPCPARSRWRPGCRRRARRPWPARRSRASRTSRSGSTPPTRSGCRAPGPGRTGRSGGSSGRPRAAGARLVRLAGQADRQATISAPSRASVRAASAKPLSQQISRPRRPTGVSKAANVSPAP